MTADTGFLPRFRRLSTTFGLILLAELLALVLTLASAGTADQFWSELGLKSLFILWVTLTTALGLSSTEVWWRRLNVRYVCGWVLLVLLGMSSSAVYLLDMLMPDWTVDDSFFIYGKTVLIAAVCGGLWLRYQFMVYQRRLQSQAESAARLDALQARMRPHFLFNSLNAIVSLLVLDTRRAEDLLLDLAELFRAILKQDQRLTTVRDEVRLARQYLSIEQQRLGDRLQVNWAIDAAAESARLPPLSLQPLLENAVYHGIEPSALPGVIIISARVSRNRLIITVTNPLPEPNQSIARQGNRLAVQNLRLRLENCFSGEAMLQTSVVDERYQVRMVVPVILEGD